jgi:peptidoglycan/xylan/chitin deacetylase (PgdA/CDA1 family)
MAAPTLTPKTAVRFLTGPLSRTLFRPLMRNRATIFMLHRIHNPDAGIHGHSISFIREAIAALRASGAKPVSLRTLINAWRSDSEIDPDWVIFTIDDGFADHATMAQEAFVSMECPATIFLISGFLDGHCWPWDDQLSFLIRHADERVTSLDIAGKQFPTTFAAPNGRWKTLEAIRDHCKSVRGLDPYEAARTLSKQLGIALPEQPPNEYKPMSWSRARELEATGLVEFGPHSVSHRVFSTLTTEQAHQEIDRSWSRLQAEMSTPLPILAWPTGRPGDFEYKDIQIAQRLGLLASVATKPGYAHKSASEGTNALFQLPRFSLPNHLSTVLRYGSWLERGRELLPV